MSESDGSSFDDVVVKQAIHSSATNALNTVAISSHCILKVVVTTTNAVCAQLESCKTVDELAAAIKALRQAVS